MTKVLLVLAIAIFLLRFVHLSADYPRNIRWDDAAATDEGWYAAAAINAHTWGASYLPGDFNSAIALPVWPLLLRGVFAVTGLGLAPMRATAVVCALITLLLMLLLLKRYGAEEWVAIYALLLALNPWSFAFSRTGLLETPMLMFCVMALVLAAGRQRTEDDTLDWPRALGIGVLFLLALLTKALAIGFAPVLLLAMGERRGWKWKRALPEAALAAVTSISLYAIYWMLCMRQHADDVRFFGSVNESTFHLSKFVADVTRPFRYGRGSDHLMFSLGIAVIVAAVLLPRMRPLWRQPLFAISAAWISCILLLMIARNNAPVRYFVAIIPALPLMAIALLANRQWRWRTAFVALLALDGAVGAAQIGIILAKPRYTLRDASLAIRQIVNSEPGNHVVLGDNSDELALAGGWKPVNLLFHAKPIDFVLDQYQPEWYVDFSPADPGTCLQQTLRAKYSVEARGRWELFYPGSEVTLYKLDKRTRTPSSFTAEQREACEVPSYE